MRRDPDGPARRGLVVYQLVLILVVVIVIILVILHVARTANHAASPPPQAHATDHAGPAVAGAFAAPATMRRPAWWG